MTARFRHAFLIPAIFALSSAQAAEPAPAPLFPFVLPWDDASGGVTNVSDLLDKPAGVNGPVQARSGHLYTGAKRLRLLGVNFCFGANFPTHADAEKVAARLAKFGVNAVRFHHMDMQSAPGGIFKPDMKTLDPEQLDKLDYLFAQLKKNGIYGDLNLHVSRAYPGLPTWEGMPGFLKGVDNFDPESIAMQKAYAHDLLTHVNPYTKTRYADESAVAIVEINNENALLHEWWSGGLDEMHARYAGELTRRWNAWLTAHYSSTAELKRVWDATEEPLGREMLSDSGFALGLDNWNVEKHEGAEATAKVLPGSPAKTLGIEVPRAATQGWHVQINQGGLAFKADRPYTVTFRARADAPRTISVSAMMAHDPWRQLWTVSPKLTTEWHTFTYVFAPADAESNGRIGFSNLGAAAGWYEFADVSLRPGGMLGLEGGESRGNVHIFGKSVFGSRTAAAQRDWVRFLWETEDGYWSEMYRYLKEDLHVKAPIVGTQMGWSPAPIQAKLDVIDSHAYWQHPNFPGRDWDMDNWTVQNLPMAGRSDGGTLPGLALTRVAGKPFICTEYNHSAPNTYAAETIPEIAAFAAMQDWDGVFLFAYSHRKDDWNAGKITSFFDIDQHPTKMVTLPGASALFLRKDLGPVSPPILAYFEPGDWIETFRKFGPTFRGDRAPRSTYGLKPLETKDGVRTPVAIALERDYKPTPDPLFRHGQQPWTWDWGSGLNPPHLLVDTPRSKILAMNAAPGKKFAMAFGLGDVTIAAEENRQDFAVITLTAMDGPDCHSPGHLLLTASGTAENTGMKWTNDRHESVGRNWGERPSLVEGVRGWVRLNVPATQVRAWALDEKGQRSLPVPIEAMKLDGSLLKIGPEYRTLWYEIEIGPQLRLSQR